MSTPTITERDLEWIQMKKEFDKMKTETAKEKMVRKIGENPLVPLGCIATAAALSFGLYNFRKGRQQMSQKMMRWRIAAQGFTLISLVIGVALTYDKKT